MATAAEKKRVGRLIRRRRQELGMRQPELAERVGVSSQAVSNWENGRSYPARWEGRIEAVLGISLTEVSQPDAPPVDPQVQSMIDRLTPEQKLDVIRALTGREDEDPPVVLEPGRRAS